MAGEKIYLNNIDNPALPVQLGAFGELITAHKTPVVQISNRYQLDPSNVNTLEVFEATGGNGTNNGNLFQCSTGTSLGGYGVVRSKNTLNYRAGQGVEAQFTAKFTTGVALSLQFGGMFSLTETLAFGYDGVNFSTLHSYGGAAEVQLLTVTATGAGTTTITLDGDSVGITTTAGTVQTVAEELRVGLAADGTLGAKWRFEQIDDKVYCISQSVGNKTGTMSATGASTVTISEQTAGVVKTDNHVAQSSWSETTTPFVGFDPTKLNIYKVEYGYLGSANINYSIYDPNNGSWVLVNVIRWANNNNGTSLGSPDLKIGWTSASLGATGTNLIVEGASASMMIEGDERLTNDTHATSASQGSVGTTATNVLSLKNRVVFGDRYNLGKIKPLRLSVDNDHTKGVIIEILKNPVIGGVTNYQLVDEFNSVAAVDSDGTTITGGELIDGFTIEAGGSATINLEGVTPDIFPEDILVISARTASGSGATITSIITWREDK